MFRVSAYGLSSSVKTTAGTASAGGAASRASPVSHVVKLGRRSYDWTLAAQEKLFKIKVAEEQRIRKSYAARLMNKTASAESRAKPLAPEVSSIPDVVLTVEHTPGVYTVGKRQMPGHFLGGEVGSGRGATVDGLEQQLPQSHHGQQVAKIRRGGGVTWHGPGQITVYPIVSVKRWWETSPQALDVKGSSPLRWYTDVLEKAIIDGVANCVSSSSSVGDGSGVGGSGDELGVDVVRKRLAARLTGVWFDDKKVASIGLQVSDWISMHGYAVNITSDPSWFDKIVMCELPGKHATNLTHIIKDVRKGGSDADTAASRLSPRLDSCEDMIVTSLLGRLSGSDSGSDYNRHQSLSNVSESLVESGRLSSQVVVHDLKEMDCEEVNTVLDRIASGL